jgi:uncharacterized protein (DUF1697 family)
MVMNVALLRAVNLAGKNAVSMADVRELFSEFEAVKTLLNSGNVVFSGKTSESALEQKAQKRFGFAIDFFLRSANEWDTIVAANPFTREAKADPGRLVVLTLKNRAKDFDWRGPEILRVDGRNAYAFYPDGQGRSKLTNAVLEKNLGTRVTGRNWNTVLKIQAALRG